MSGIRCTQTAFGPAGFSPVTHTYNSGRNRINTPKPVKEPRDEKPPADPARG